MNKITIGGRLCEGAELKYHGDGKPMFRGSLAVWNSWKKESEFFDFVFFGKRAQLLSEWVKPGQYLIVDGEVNISKYNDKQTGAKRTGWSVKGSDFEIPRSKEDMPDNGEGSRSGGRPDDEFAAPPRGGAEDGDDLPF